MNSSMCLYLKMDYLKAHGRRVNAFGQWVSLHRSNRVINLPNVTLRELESKCVPLLFLGWLPETRRSAIGQFFPLSWVTLQEIFAKVNSIQFLFVASGACATHNDRAFTTNVYVHTEINRWLFFLKENCTGMTCQTLLIVTPSSLCF